MLMNRIGRKNTVLISLFMTVISLLIPLAGEGYAVMLLSFSLLGIGNAIMQTSLNPLVTNLISTEQLASTLTFGQFVKAIASFLAPVLAAWGATTALTTFGLGWRVLFLIYAAFSILSFLALSSPPIREERPDKATGVVECLRLLSRPFILLCFIGIMCHVGVDVGVNTAAPKILMERLHLPLEEAGFATSVYFIFRTAGCFLGAFLLRSMAPRLFFGISVALMLVSMGMLFVCDTLFSLYIALGIVGLGNSNIFSVVFSQALIASPKEKNEVSGLLIMGLFGGTIFPLAMGFAADYMGQTGSVAILTAGIAYLLYYTFKIK